MDRAIMILKDSKEWYETQIEYAKKAISDGACGQDLAECKKTIEENKLYTKEIKKALEKLDLI